MSRNKLDLQIDVPSTADDAPDALFNQSLEKGIAVLRAFSAQRRTMTLPEVAEATSITKSSAQRMIYTLEKLGYVKKHPRTKRYQLALKAMQIGFNYLAADTLIDVANPFLSELTNVTGETTNLTEPDEPCGIAAVYFEGWHVFERDGTESDYGTIPNDDAGSDRGAGRDPGAIADLNWLNN